MTTVGRAGRWALAASAVVALGAFGIGAAGAEPNDGITGGAGNNGGVNVNMGPFGGGMNVGRNGGFNFGPNGIGAGGGQNHSANVNMGPFGGDMNVGRNGGFNFGPNGIGAGGGQNNSANVNMGPFGGGYHANTGGGVNFGGR